MNIATAIISQLNYQRGWKPLFTLRIEETSRVNQEIRNAVKRATDRFKERLGDSPTATFILEAPLVQEALGKSIAAYIDEPYHPENLMWDELGINPEIASREQFNLGISILGEEIRRELLTVPEIKRFVEAKQLRDLEKRTIDMHNSLNTEAGEILSKAIDEAKFLLNADLLVLYFYNQISGEWADKPISIDDTPISNKAVADWARNVLTKNEPLLLNPSEISGSFVRREKISSVIAIPLIHEEMRLGVLFANYRTRQDFNESYRRNIQQVVEKVSEALYRYIFAQLDVELVESDTLRVQLLLPKGITTSQFFQISQDNIQNIEHIYLILSLIYSGDRRAINRLISVTNRNQEKKKTTTLAQVRAIANGKKVNVQPPLLVAIKYGSPGSFDLLGIGKIFEILRDMIKDVKWRGKHETEIAEMERESKKLEIQRAQIENEKAIIQVASEKLTLLERIANLELTKDERNIVVSALLPQLNSIYDLNPTFLLPDKTKNRKRK